jgi:superfamily I DNA/RNA helicase
MTMTFKPSKYQEAIFRFITEGTGNAIVQAVAGSGKTTTLVEALKCTEGRGKALFCAFNKAIVQELEKRAPKNVKVATLHSLGYGIMARNLARKLTVNDDKVRGIVRAMLDRDATIPDNATPMITQLVRLVQSCTLEGTPEDIEWVADHYGVLTNGTSVYHLSQWVRAVIQESTQRALDGEVDFNDMVYVTALKLRDGKWKTWTYDWVFVDEAQDLSVSQRIILEHLMGPNSRLVAVGDEAQAIYGFRGADVDSMKLLGEHFKCVELPLSICYRCPKSHVDLAKASVPQIEAAETAIEGTVESIGAEALPARVEDGDLVMCRRNAPLLPLALQVIALGKKATVMGRDIGTGLVKLIQKAARRSNNLLEALRNLADYRDNECAKLMHLDKEAQAQQLMDRVECIEVLSDGLTTVNQLVSRIESVFSDDAKGVVFSSIHRAKGLEADRTFIVEFERMPLVWRNQRDWQFKQEVNLRYVALTRAKKALHLVALVGVTR